MPKKMRRDGASGFGTPSPSEIGKRLRTLREAAGYTSRGDFAMLLGIPRTTYANYEYGACSLSLETIWDICSVLKITPNDLMGFGDGDIDQLVLHERLVSLESSDSMDVLKRAVMPNADAADALLAIGLLTSRTLSKRAGRGTGKKSPSA